MIEKIIILSLTILMTAGCMTSRETVPDTGTATAQSEYRIHPSDVLEVTYTYTPEFNQAVTVQPDGIAVLNIIGAIKVSGLTLEQVRRIIVEKTSVRLQQPEVNVALKDFEKPYFVVSGEVKLPGKYEMHQTLTALQAVMVAGGFTRDAKDSAVLLFRRSSNGTSEPHTINLDPDKIRAESGLDPILVAGDMLMVPQSNFAFLERFIKLVTVGFFLTPF